MAAIDEVRVTFDVDDIEGWWPGQTFALDAPEHDFHHDTFTITDITVKWIRPAHARYTIGAALGAWAAVATAGEDGGPIRSPSLATAVQKVAYESSQDFDPTHPLALGNAIDEHVVRFFMNMDPPDGLYPDFAGIEIAPDRGAYALWDPAGTVTFSALDGQVIVQETTGAAWISAGLGAPASLGVVVAGCNWILIMVGGRHGEVLGGTQTTLP